MLAARAVSPVVGIALLLALTVVTSSVVAVGALDLAAEQTAPPQATVDVRADGSTGRIIVTHRGGEAIDVDELELVVTVDGEKLRRQPPVPFFSARGFVSGPTGPFNAAADQRWTAGESASFVIAGTNAPTLSPRDVVVVTLVVEGRVVASVRSVATGQSVASSGSTLSLPAPRSPAMSGSGSSSGSTLSLPAPRSPAMSGSGSSAGVLATSSSPPGTRATVVMATSGS
ncbi:type IV pilin [Haloarchaeobius iranensis]|uniref:type IV pilin n=1 Tax=Haloarchaeobius iranensis TaxID=996166 RepID=UPI001FDEAC7A|nr:type IV pilin N-terminal domain-containing protein [Haloarchaeobius iranensis]